MKINEVIRSIAGNDEAERKQRENLTFLRHMAASKLELAEMKLLNSLTGNGDGVSKLFIIPESITNFQQGYTISNSSSPDEGISKAVDDLFSGKYLDALKQMIQSAVRDLFESTLIGEDSKTDYFVFFEHNAIVRIDVYFWKYYFENKGLYDKAEQAFCFTLCKSVVDHTKVGKDTLLYLISQHLSKDAQSTVTIKEFIEELNELWGLLQTKPLADVKLSAINNFKRN